MATPATVAFLVPSQVVNHACCPSMPRAEAKDRIKKSNIAVSSRVGDASNNKSDKPSSSNIKNNLAKGGIVSPSKNRNKDANLVKIPNDSSDTFSSSMLVPSQAIHSFSTVTEQPTQPKKNSNRKKKSKKKVIGEKKKLTNPPEIKSEDHKPRSVTSPPGKKTKQGSNTTRHHQMTGNYPNLFWGAFPMDHLRQHPKFKPLPPTCQIRSLTTIQDVSNFRQDSWQWDALHRGRMTTSHAASALGLVNPKAATLMGVPRSLRQSGAMGAYNRMSGESLPTDVDELNSILIDDDSPGEPDSAELSKGEKIWSPRRTNKFPFVAKYMSEDTHCPIEKEQMIVRAENARMFWGSIQEATAILTALNYFVLEVDSGIEMFEVGMRVGQPSTCFPIPEDLLLGASPDALISYPNGTIEVLEVKNHCPFARNIPRNNRSSKKKHNPGKKYRIQTWERPTSIQPAYIPQLMMEMACVGPECTSAVMVRQTATRGATILRLKRDDDWIKEMVFWLSKFKADFVEKGIPPHENFFWDCSPDDSDISNAFENGQLSDRYRTFVKRTKELGDSVEVVAQIPNSKIQRAGVVGTSTSLFLDEAVAAV